MTSICLNSANEAMLSANDMSLFLDYYQLTMGQADFDSDNNASVTANYYVRRIPQGQYLIAAGLEQVIHYILNLCFTDTSIDWLTTHSNLHSDYLNSLKDFNFQGSVSAVPEGTPVFPNEPIINITGNTRDVQLFETYLLCVMNYQTLIATKASRIVNAAKGNPVYDFGARRAHGRDAAILSARASFIGGASGTSLVLASKYFDIPFVGTMAHKFISERADELTAFRDYAASFPNNVTLLIDTYETLTGARNACIVAKEMEAKGTRLQAVRLDSGDLLTLSKAVRNILDTNGLDYVKIIASNDLDEFQIDKLLKNDAPIDMFGVGTRLATGANFDSIEDHGGVSALGGVYKVVESDGKPIVKKSVDEPDKATIPFRKQVYRLKNTDGKYKRDCLTRWNDNTSQGEPLLVPIVEQGELVYDFPSLQSVQSYTVSELDMLDNVHKHLKFPRPYDVEIHSSLTKEVTQK